MPFLIRGAHVTVGQDETQRPNKSDRGLRHVVAAATYSFGGFKQLILEAAFRQEMFCYAVILVLFAFVGASLPDYLIATILFLILAAVEALNTGIENIVDKMSPEISDFAKHTKDLGSFAVFCLLTANGLFALYVVVRIVFPDWV
jgi:diacylglycerol kinase (ATP)